MNLFRSKYEGNLVNGRMEGNGALKLPYGIKYQGEMKDGHFHGKGTIFFQAGGRFVGEWCEGKKISGKFFFDDGLEFNENTPEWDYLTPEDRRFYKESQNALNPHKQDEIIEKDDKKVLSNQSKCGVYPSIPGNLQEVTPTPTHLKMNFSQQPPQ